MAVQWDETIRTRSLLEQDDSARVSITFANSGVIRLWFSHHYLSVAEARALRDLLNEVFEEDEGEEGGDQEG